MTMQLVASKLKKFPMLDDKGQEFDFWDLNSITADIDAWRCLIDSIAAKYRESGIDTVVGLDARGFFFASAIADALGVGFISARKPGKLPGKTVSVTYDLEYGSNTLLLQDEGYITQGSNVLIVDDVLATGGTANAACQLVGMLGGNVVGIAVAIEIPFLAGRSKLMDRCVSSEMTILNGEVKPNSNVRYCVDPLIVDEESGQLLLIERLNEPKGFAMAGGGIETGETVVETVVREIYEEVGLMISPAQIEFYSVLTGADRDPRGDQVSYVCKITCDTKGAVGETDKTIPVWMDVFKVGMAKMQSKFAFADHEETIYGHFREKFPSENTAAD